MLRLFFPNTEAVRVAVVSGIVPLTVARSRVSASFDTGKGIWLKADAELPGVSYAALHRLGARSYAMHSDASAVDYPCWAALIPLRPIRERRESEVALFELPTERLSRFLGTLDRLDSRAARFRILEDSSIVLVERPPLYLHEFIGADEYTLRYRPLARNVWIASCCDLEDVPEKLVETDGLTLIGPVAGWRSFLWEEFAPMRRYQSFGNAAPISGNRNYTAARLAIPLRATRSAKHDDPEEKLWITSGAWSSLAPHFREWDERLLRRLEMMVVKTPDGEWRTIVRMARNTKINPVFAAPFRAYTPVQGIDGLFIPSGRCLLPRPSPKILTSVFGIIPGNTVWLECDGHSFAVNRASNDAFRPLANALRYNASSIRNVPDALDETTIFALPGFIVLSEAKPFVEPSDSTSSPMVKSPSKKRTFSGWMQRVAGRLFPSRKQKTTQTAFSLTTPKGETPANGVSPNEWSARRKQLERIILEMPASTPDAIRSKAWRELAQIVTAIGDSADAAHAWVQALWCKSNAPQEWAEAWYNAELSAAKIPVEQAGNEELLARKPGVALARAFASHFVLTMQPVSNADAMPTVSKMYAVIERYADDLPIRLIWLARSAIAHRAQGDALGLARCRDLLMARLAAGGPAFEPDAPTFLRFEAQVGAAHFHAAGKWLRRTRENAHRWLQSLGTSGRLQWAGLEADMIATRAYADLIFACGAAKLGDRSKSQEWLEHSGEVLAKAEGPGVEPAVHKHLLERFRQKIRAGRFEESDEAGRAIPEFAQKELSRYAVEKLTAQLSILSGGRIAVDPYGYRGLQSLLPTGGSAMQPSDVARLLAEAASERTAGNLPPRVLLALGFARTETDAAEVLALLPSALELLPESLRNVGTAGADTSLPFVRWGIRAIELACILATKYRLPKEFRGICTLLMHPANDGGVGFREILSATAGRIFSTCRVLGLLEEIAALLREFTDRGALPPAAHLLPAIGWFALGNEDAGTGLLNDARRNLFEVGRVSEKDRGALALAYAQTLAHAPHTLAMGRLEEMFQRLDRVAVGGAASRYYALKPLEIIDAAVTAVVNQNFALDTSAMHWLAEDESRIRRRIVRDLDRALDDDASGAPAP